MLFGLLNDDTQLQNDPAKMALFGAGLGLANAQGNTGADYLRSAIEGAGRGYGAYQSYQQQLLERQQKARQAELDNLYKAAQTKKVLYDLGADERKRQQRVTMQNSIRELGLPAGQTNLLLAMKPEDASRELGEIRNEQLVSNTTSKSLQAFMQREQLPAHVQAAAMEVMANAKTGQEGYTAALRFLKDSNAYDLKKGTDAALIDPELYAKTLPEMPWDTDGSVRRMAIEMVRNDGDVQKAESFIDSAMSRIKPAEAEDGTKISTNGTVVMRNFKPVKGNDGLWYNPNTGERLEGGFKYGMAADGSGFMQRFPDKAERTMLRAYGMGIRSTKELADIIENKRSTLGLFGSGVVLENILSPQELSGLGTQYILVLMDLKTKFELGAITGPDMQILEQAIANPMEFLRTTNADSFINQIRQMQKTLFMEFENAAESQNYDPMEHYNNTYAAGSFTFKPFDLGTAPSAAGSVNVAPQKSKEELEWERRQQQSMQMGRDLGFQQ